MLQRNYQQIADQFGISKRQAARAINDLERLGVIRKEFRNLVVKNQNVNNVLFIELNPEKLKELTYSQTQYVSVSHSDVRPITAEGDRPIQQNVGGTAIDCSTNTTKPVDKED